MTPSPGTYRIDSDEGIVYISGTEVASLTEWTNFLDSILADPAFRPGFCLISDRRNMQSTPPAGYARDLADRIVARRDRLKGARWAIVVNSTVSYGLGRLIELSIEDAGVEMHVFNDYEEGLRWIREKRRR